jgi:TQXA domain-containing protein
MRTTKTKIGASVLCLIFAVLMFVQPLSYSAQDSTPDEAVQQTTQAQSKVKNAKSSVGASQQDVVDSSTRYVSFYDDQTALTFGKDTLFTYTLFPYYVTTESNYKTYAGSRNLLINNSDIVYCFNKLKGQPLNNTEGTFNNYYFGGTLSNVYAYYQLISNVSGQKFLSLTDTEHRAYSAEELRKRVLSIGLNGYPLDYSHYNNGRLTAKEFRAITQLAIWRFTDDLTKDDDTGKYVVDCLTDDELYVYNKLITELLDDDTLEYASGKIDLYQSKGISTSNSNYNSVYNGDFFQNLLSVGGTNHTTLTLQKMVDYDDVDMDEEFTFAIFPFYTNQYLYTMANTTLPVTPGVVEGSGATAPNITSITTNSNGYAVVKLKYGQKIDIDVSQIILQYGNYGYQIQEIDPSPYTAQIDAPSNATVYSSNNAVVHTNINQNEFVQYTNVRKTSGVTLQKTVTGNGADTNKEFEFKVLLSGYSDGSNTPLNNKTFSVKSGVVEGSGATAPNITSITTDSNGYATVKLKHGQTITINTTEVAEEYGSFSYEVTETSADNYTANIASITGATISGAKITHNNITGKETVKYTNNYVKPVKLTLQKMVTGNGANKDDSFDFTVALGEYNSSAGKNYVITNQTLPVTPGVVEGSGATAPNITSITTDSSGKATVSLKHGQKIDIDVSSIVSTYGNYTYVIQEGVPSNYTASIECSSSSASINSPKISHGNATVGETVTYTNKYESPTVSKSLTLRKLVSGNMGDRSKKFNYTIQLKGLKDGTWSDVTADLAVTSSVVDGTNATAPSITSLSFKNGKAENVKLSHGQEIKIDVSDLFNTYGYEDYGFVITEEDSSPYRATVDTKPEGATVSNNNCKVSLNGVKEDDAVVQYTNNYDVVASGITSNTMPLLIAVAFAVVFAGTFLAIKFRKKERKS